MRGVEKHQHCGFRGGGGGGGRAVATPDHISPTIFEIKGLPKMVTLTLGHPPPHI